MIGTISLINHRFKDFGKPSNIVIAWFLLAFADFAAAWINNILWIGTQGRIDSILPFGSPTLLAVNTVLGYATRIIGFHGLAGLLWLLLYVVWNRKTTKKVSYMVALCLIILSSFGWLLWRASANNKRHPFRSG